MLILQSISDFEILINSLTKRDIYTKRAQKFLNSLQQPKVHVLEFPEFLIKALSYDKYDNSEILDKYTYN